MLSVIMQNVIMLSMSCRHSFEVSLWCSYIHWIFKIRFFKQTFVFFILLKCSFVSSFSNYRTSCNQKDLIFLLTMENILLECFSLPNICEMLKNFLKLPFNFVRGGNSKLECLPLASLLFPSMAWPYLTGALWQLSKDKHSSLFWPTVSDEYKKRFIRMTLGPKPQIYQMQWWEILARKDLDFGSVPQALSHF